MIPNRDEAGRRHAREVAGSIEGVAASVGLVEPGAGKDVSDHLAAGHGVDDLVRVSNLDTERALGGAAASIACS